jgi:hypothetical protein
MSAMIACSPAGFFYRPEQRWAARSEKPPPRSGNSDTEPLPGERRKKEPLLDWSTNGLLVKRSSKISYYGYFVGK